LRKEIAKIQAPVPPLRIPVQQSDCTQEAEEQTVLVALRVYPEGQVYALHVGFAAQ